MPDKTPARLFSRFAGKRWALLICGAGLACCTAVPSRPVVSGQQLLDQLASGRPVRVDNQTFSDDIDFTRLPASPETESVARVWINAPVYFRNCTFNGKVLAFRQQGDTTILCQFGRNLAFINCRFNNDTRFQSVSVAGIGCFSRTQFNRPVSFEGAQFGAEAYFDQALFATEARFQQARFARQATFWQTVWAGTTYFQGAAFAQDAQFNLCDFRANLDFSLCTTDGLLNFNYAQLTGRSSFADCRFRNTVDFGGAMLNDASFQGAYFAAKTLFTDVRTSRLSFQDAFFLRQRPTIALTGSPRVQPELTGCRVAAAGPLPAGQ